MEHMNTNKKDRCSEMLVVENHALKSEQSLVILLGWLGCQPRNLRRYQELYIQQNFQVVSSIASASAIVNASCSWEEQTKHYPVETSSSNDNNKQQQSYFIDGKNKSVYEIACELIPFIQNSNGFIVHAFSNGGCFVWEALRFRILQQQQQELLLYHKFWGLVLDSAPAFYSGLGDEQDVKHMNGVLHYCESEQERKEIQQRLESIFHDARERRKLRARQFWHHMQHDTTWGSQQQQRRQLFLCSKTDHLTSFSHLWELIQIKQSNNNVVWYRIWESSPHCSHLLKHPDEYKEIVIAFVRACIRDNKKKNHTSDNDGIVDAKDLNVRSRL